MVSLSFNLWKKVLYDSIPFYSVLFAAFSQNYPNIIQQFTRRPKIPVHSWDFILTKGPQTTSKRPRNDLKTTSNAMKWLRRFLTGKRSKKVKFDVVSDVMTSQCTVSRTQIFSKLEWLWHQNWPFNFYHDFYQCITGK